MRRPRLKRLLLAVLAAALIAPAAAAAFTLVELLVVIAVIEDVRVGLAAAVDAIRDCDQEPDSVSVRLAGELNARLLVGRADGSFDFHIQPADLTGTGPRGVSVRIVGAASGTARPDEPFTIDLPLVGSSELGQIQTRAELSLVLTPNPSERTVNARLLRIRALDPCDPRSRAESAVPPTNGGAVSTAGGFESGGVTNGMAVAGAALLGLAALGSRRRRP